MHWVAVQLCLLCVR